MCCDTNAKKASLSTPFRAHCQAEINSEINYHNHNLNFIWESHILPLSLLSYAGNVSFARRRPHNDISTSASARSGKYMLRWVRGVAAEWAGVSCNVYIGEHHHQWKCTPGCSEMRCVINVKTYNIALMSELSASSCASVCELYDWKFMQRNARTELTRCTPARVTMPPHHRA